MLFFVYLKQMMNNKEFQEKELKILEINKTEIIKKLEAIGAIFDFKKYFRAIYYNNKHFNLRDIKKTLRLRKEGEKVLLTLKDKTKEDNFVFHKETEVEISDFDNLNFILTNLGFYPILDIEKERIQYHIIDSDTNIKLTFAIDTYLNDYSFIPTFLEIESIDFALIFKYIEKIGYNKNNDKIKNLNVFELIELYKNEKK